MDILEDQNKFCTAQPTKGYNGYETSVGVPVQVGLSLVLGLSTFFAFCVSMPLYAES